MRYLQPEQNLSIDELSAQCWGAVERAQDAQDVFNQFANPVRMNGGSWRACATDRALTALYG